MAKAKIGVHAGNYQQYLSWCRENNKSPYTDGVFFISEAHRLKGLRDIDIVKYGTWYERNDLKEIEAEILSMKV